MGTASGGWLRPLALGAVLMIGSCAEQKAPYADLTEDSYGPLARRAPIACDPQQPGDDFSRKLATLIMSPLKSANQVDQSLVDEGLTDKFEISGDPGMFPVAMITHDDDHVLFWYVLGIVRPREVDAAAEQFCRNRKRTVRWTGLAQQCAPPHVLPFSINGQQPVVRSTYVLSEYECPAPALPQSRRGRSTRPTARH